jgi:hypothetical protein
LRWHHATGCVYMYIRIQRYISGPHRPHRPYQPQPHQQPEPSTEGLTNE